MPGPRRQLTACSLGNATGTVGVEVAVGGGVFDGTAVRVGAAVKGAWVAEGVTGESVGVCVGALDGKLQADRTKTRMKANRQTRDLISLLSICFILPNWIASDNRSF